MGRPDSYIPPMGMIAHDERGAVTMARIELASGQDGDVKQLAQRTVDTQTVEIATMTTLPATVGG